MAWMWFWQPDYVNGLRAYEAWINDLTDEEGIAALAPEQFLMYWQGHAWMYDQLHDARRAAALYLGRLAEGFEEQKARLLRAAASGLDALVALMTENWDCFPYREVGTSSRPPGGGSGKSGRSSVEGGCRRTPPSGRPTCGRRAPRR